ncbi:MAG: baseplate J/gp47 family protein [Gallionella sp.]|nr:baseplate J/gp47 family protein [Gallionella sp.]MDD4947451.1 baseplate J/gp47 family protein [Gallionella sp.]
MIPYSRPSYTELLTRIEADLAAMPAVLRAPLSAAWANACNGLHGHLDWLDAQCSPLTCELERLSDWGVLYRVERLLATASTGTLLATGNVAAKLLSGALLRGPNGLDYMVVAAVTLGAGNTPVAVRCANAGADGNLIAGQVLTLVDPVAGVNNSLTVDVAGLTGGASDEPVEAWRLRVTEEWQAVVAGGARSGKPDDYRFWARSAHPSVTGAIVQPQALGMGTVVVRPICNGLTDRLPTQAVLDAVSAYYAAIAPATADWRVTAPVVRPITLSIHLQPAVDTALNRAAIFTALNALVASKGGSDVLQLMWAEVDTTIAVITLQYIANEAASIVWLAHEVPVLQPINWI